MKHITTKWRTSIFAEMDVYLADDSRRTNTMDIDDVVTVGYVEDETFTEYTGRVSDIKVEINKNAVSYGNTNSPIDTIKSDINVLSITLDCSKQYASNVVTLNAKEIVEDSESSDITKVVITPNIKASVTVVSRSESGEDSETTINDIKIGSEISPFKFKAVDGSIENITATVCKFLYEERPEGTITIPSIVVKDENGKVFVVKFKDILSLNEEAPIDPENPDDSGEITPPDGPDDEDDF